MYNYKAFFIIKSVPLIFLFYTATGSIVISVSKVMVCENIQCNCLTTHGAMNDKLQRLKGSVSLHAAAANGRDFKLKYIYCDMSVFSFT